MIFYSQIKREFPLSAWKQGQGIFHDGAVKKVRMTGDQISGCVTREGLGEIDVTMQIGRGTIRKSTCAACGGDLQEEGKRCEHVAALGIWVVERGSLLRAGIGGVDDGLAEDDGTRTSAPAPKPPVHAECIAYARGIFENKRFEGIVIEPALRYIDPESGTLQLTTAQYLRKGAQSGTWLTTKGAVLKPDPAQTCTIPVIQSIEAQKITHAGSDAIENLVLLLDRPDRERIMLEKAIDVKLDPRPLELVSLNVGRKTGKERILSYEFKNPSVRLFSTDLAALAAAGRLSNRYAWKGDRIYRFEKPLALLSKYANRSGIARDESDDELENAYSGFDTIADDAEHPLHPLTIYRLMLELGVRNFTVDPEWKDFHDWRRNFEKSKIPRLPKVDYGFTLRDYQRNGLSWLWSLLHRGLAALLADDMGLGKTHQALALLSSIYRGRARPSEPSLVIAPTSVVAAWSQKLKKYPTGLRYYIFHGKSRALPKGGVDVVLTTYGILQRETGLREKSWHVIILDEAQAIKNASTISSRASRVLNSAFRIAMTGTPIENQATDLWSLMEFLIPGYLGSLARFKRLYGSGHDGTTAYQAQALRRLMSPFLLRRTKSQVLKELPEKTEESVLCEMTQAQERRYHEYLNSDEVGRAREDIECGRKIDYAGILAILTRLKQVCDHPHLPDYSSSRADKSAEARKKRKKLDPELSGKWDAFSELVREAIASNLKIVVFTQYLGVMDLIGAWLAENAIGSTELRGDTPDRIKRIDRFAADPDCKVFVCSLLAGGLGIDLTAASVCIHFDRWWNPARENQATDRVHRIGQTRGVQVFKLQIPGTVEDRIARIIESKKSLSGALIEESPVGLKSFSRKELLELLSPTTVPAAVHGESES